VAAECGGKRGYKLAIMNSMALCMGDHSNVRGYDHFLIFYKSSHNFSMLGHYLKFLCQNVACYKTFVIGV